MTIELGANGDLRRPCEAYVFLRTSRQSTDFWRSSRYLTALAAIAAPVLLVLATHADGTFEMSRTGNDAKGLAEHYGFWVIFATTPAIVLLTGYLLDRFVEVLQKPEDFLSTNSEDKDIQGLLALIDGEIESLRLQSRMRYVAYLCILIGLMYYIINVAKTWDPADTYGHDVFDAWAHPTGYLCTKLYLLPVFTWVYPVAIFIAFHVTFSMVRVLHYLCSKDILAISFFHEDNCGGTSCFGEINMLIIGLYTLLFGVLAGMFITHEKTYFVTQSGLLFCSVVSILQSVFAVWAIHRFVRTKKKACLQAITKHLNDRLNMTLAREDEFTHGLLSARNHVAGIHTFPYAARVMLLLNGLRFAPAVLALVTFAKQ